MVFLLIYDRKKGLIVEKRVFQDSDVNSALDMRIQMELESRTHESNREIVILEAESEEHLHRTHARYFKGLGVRINPDEKYLESILPKGLLEGLSKNRKQVGRKTL